MVVRRTFRGGLFRRVSEVPYILEGLLGGLSKFSEMFFDGISTAYLSQIIVFPLALLNEVGQLCGQQLRRHDG